MTLREKIAVCFLVVSWLIFSSVLLLPFLPLEPDKLILAAVIYFISQVVFWTGCGLGGKEVMRRYQIDTAIKKWLARRRQR